jgi:hypothetical protein
MSHNLFSAKPRTVSFLPSSTTRLALTLLSSAILGLPGTLAACHAQTGVGNPLPEAPSALLAAATSAPAGTTLVALNIPPLSSSSSTDLFAGDVSPTAPPDQQQTPLPANPQASDHSQKKPLQAAAGQQPHRILGLMPNYRTVSAGVIPPPPGFKQSFRIATRQAFDYSSFIFLGLTTSTAYWQDSHPSLDTYNGGNAPFWGYLWRGFLDKTDGTYQAAWILPTLLHEDTRYYAIGHGSKWKRLGYAMSRVAIARTYSGHSTPNFAGLGGKVGAQAVSTTYYPAASEPFGVLATKFSYSCARDIGFTVFREFYPDIAIHILHRNP